MARRRIILFTPEEIRFWANSTTMGILNSENGRQLFKSFLTRTYGDIHLEVTNYLKCFEICCETRNSREELRLNLTELLNTVPHHRWERRLLLVMDMFEGPQLRTELLLILRELQQELGQLIENEPEFAAFREDLNDMTRRNTH